MKLSLINVAVDAGDTVCGYWIQNHVGTVASAQARARRIEDVNSNAIVVAVVPEVTSVVPMLDGYMAGLKPLRPEVE